MSTQRRVSSAAVLMAITGAVCSAQTVMSAHSGTLHYFEGDVAIDGTPVQAKFGKFAEVKEQSVLSTKAGRAEVLLTPGVFLRLGENSSIRMIDNRLISTRVDVLSGNVILESDDPQLDVKDSPVTLLYKDYEIQMVKHGLAELNSNPGQVKVFKGEALVQASGDAGIQNRVTVHEGHLANLSAALLTERFDANAGDDLYLWARDRSQALSAANMSSARTINSGSYGSGYGGYGSGLGYGLGYGGLGYGGVGYGPGAWNGGWYYNPYFGMYTYVPAVGTMWSPFGYGFFSPGTIYNYYSPSGYWYGGGGPVGASAVGRPSYGLRSSTTRTAPINDLLSSTGRVSSGSPLRTGEALGSAAAAGGATRGGVPTASSSGGGGNFGSRGGSIGGGGGHAGGGHR